MELQLKEGRPIIGVVQGYEKVMIKGRDGNLKAYDFLLDSNGKRGNLTILAFAVDGNLKFLKMDSVDNLIGERVKFEKVKRNGKTYTNMALDDGGSQSDPVGDDDWGNANGADDGEGDDGWGQSSGQKSSPARNSQATSGQPFVPPDISAYLQSSIDLYKKILASAMPGIADEFEMQQMGRPTIEEGNAIVATILIGAQKMAELAQKSNNKGGGYRR